MSDRYIDAAPVMKGVPATLADTSDAIDALPTQEGIFVGGFHMAGHGAAVAVAIKRKDGSSSIAVTSPEFAFELFTELGRVVEAVMRGDFDQSERAQ